MKIKMKIKISKENQLFLKNIKNSFLFFNITYLFFMLIQILYKSY